MLGNQTVLIFSYFCFLPDSTTTPPSKGELITIYNIYRSLCRSYIVLRWTQQKLFYFLTFQTRNNALNHLEILMFSLDIYIYIHIFVWKSRIKFGNWIKILQIYIYIYIYIYVYVYVYIYIYIYRKFCLTSA